jgi:hypothetical protein
MAGGGSTGGSGGTGGGSGGGGTSPPQTWTGYEYTYTTAYLLSIPNLEPIKIGMVQPWNNSIDICEWDDGLFDTREGRGSEFVAPWDKHGNPVYDENGSPITDRIVDPTTGQISYETREPFRPSMENEDVMVPYWEGGSPYSYSYYFFGPPVKYGTVPYEDWARWKYPSTNTQSYTGHGAGNIYLTWNYSKAWRTGGYKRKTLWPIKDKYLWNQTEQKIYTEDNPPDPFNPETGEPDSYYWQDAYKWRDGPYEGYGLHYARPIGFTKLTDPNDPDSDPIPDAERGGGTAQPPPLAYFLNRWNSGYGFHNGWEIHKDHLLSYNAKYNPFSKPTESLPNWCEPDYRASGVLFYTNKTSHYDADGQFIKWEYIPVLQVRGRAGHKWHRGMKLKYEVVIEIDKEEYSYNIPLTGETTTHTIYSKDLRRVQFTLSYEAAHDPPAFDAVKPYDYNPDRDSTTPPPDYDGYGGGASTANVEYPSQLNKVLVNNGTSSYYTYQDKTIGAYPDTVVKSVYGGTMNGFNITAIGAKWSGAGEPTTTTPFSFYEDKWDWTSGPRAGTSVRIRERIVDIQLIDVNHKGFLEYE